MEKFITTRRLAQLAALVIAALLLWYLRAKGVIEPAAIFSLTAEHPIAAPLVFTIVYAVSVVALLPTSTLNVAAGVFWGPWLGSLVAIGGSCTGAILAFSLARITFGQVLARRHDWKLINWAQEEVERNGWKVVALVRLNPLFPGPVNHAFGMTSISLKTFSWATLVFATPLTVAFAIVGHVAGDIVHPTGNIKLWMIVFGLTALAIALLFARWLRPGSRRLAGSNTPGVREKAATNE